MAEIATFDPTDEGTGSQLSIDLAASTSYKLLEQSMPAPPLNPQWAGSVDTEGERVASRRHGNRTITHRWDVFGSSDATLETAVNALTAKVAKFQAEGGTFRRTSPSGTVRTYDVLAADGYDRPFDISYYTGYRASVAYTLTAKPYSRGAQVAYGPFGELTGPVLVFTIEDVPGDVPAEGRIDVTNGAAFAQNALIWGLQSRYVDTTGGGALFFEAEACDAGPDAAAAAGPSGASGSGSNTVRHQTLTAAYQIVVSGGTSGVNKTHLGDFRVLTRVQAPTSNTGIVSVRYQYQPTVNGAPVTNTPVQLAVNGVATEGSWAILDLGTVSISSHVSDGQANIWRGNVEAASTGAGDDIYVDWIGLVPITEGSGVISKVSTAAAIAASTSSTIRHNGAFVKASGFWVRPDKYEGDYLLIPPAGAEDRKARFFVKASRAVFGPAGGDSAIDDITATVWVTPRYLT